MPLNLLSNQDDVGMKEAIHDRHGSNAPATYIEGQLPIDGLFVTSAITTRAGGYVSFDQGIQGQRTDHQCLWIDLNITSIFGSEIPLLMRFQGRRVKSKHPRIAHRFNHVYKHFAIKHGLAHKIFQLEAEGTEAESQRDHQVKV